MEVKIQAEEVSSGVGRLGSRLGIVGALMLAMNNMLSPFGYILFLGSSICLLFWAKKNNFSHQVEMQLVFTVVNAVGAYNWIFKPFFL